MKSGRLTETIVESFELGERLRKDLHEVKWVLKDGCYRFCIWAVLALSLLEDPKHQRRMLYGETGLL